MNIRNLSYVLFSLSFISLSPIAADQEEQHDTYARGAACTTSKSPVKQNKKKKESYQDAKTVPDRVDDISDLLAKRVFDPLSSLFDDDNFFGPLRARSAQIGYGEQIELKSKEALLKTLTSYMGQLEKMYKELDQLRYTMKYRGAYPFADTQKAAKNTLKQTQADIQKLEDLAKELKETIGNLKESPQAKKQVHDDTKSITTSVSSYSIDDQYSSDKTKYIITVRAPGYQEISYTTDDSNNSIRISLAKKSESKTEDSTEENGKKAGVIKTQSYSSSHFVVVRQLPTGVNLDKKPKETLDNGTLTIEFAVKSTAKT